MIVDFEQIEIVDILEYREQARLIEYFKNKGTAWCEGIEVFCSNIWRGFIYTAQAVFPGATVVVDRFHSEWIEETSKMKNKHLNNFLYMLNARKEYVLNYFIHRVIASIIEGINNSFKTVKRIGYDFLNFISFKQRVVISFT